MLIKWGMGGWCMGWNGGGGVVTWDEVGGGGGGMMMAGKELATGSQ